MSSPSVLTNCAIVVKCGAVSPHSAMNVTWSWRARHVIPKTRIEVRQIDRPVEQMIERVLERAGQELLRQINGQEARIGIDVRKTRHATSSTARGADHTVT
jgi:hypothetical protein